MDEKPLDDDMAKPLADGAEEDLISDEALDLLLSGATLPAQAEPVRKPSVLRDGGRLGKLALMVILLGFALFAATLAALFVGQEKVVPREDIERANREAARRQVAEKERKVQEILDRYKSLAGPRAAQYAGVLRVNGVEGLSLTELWTLKAELSKFGFVQETTIGTQVSLEVRVSQFYRVPKTDKIIYRSSAWKTFADVWVLPLLLASVVIAFVGCLAATRIQKRLDANARE